MWIRYDPSKRLRTLQERGLDFEDALEVFSGSTYEIQDVRRDYGEARITCFGFLAERLVVVCYVSRGETRHVFSMRKANGREQIRLNRLGLRSGTR